MTFKRTDLINAVVDATDLTRRDAERAVFAVQDALTRALANGQKVTLFGFGSLTPRVKEPHIGRDPSTGLPTEVGRRGRVSFSASPKLREYVVDPKTLPKDGLVTDVRPRRSKES